MPRVRLPESQLTEAQLKRRIRNDRYRNKTAKNSNLMYLIKDNEEEKPKYKKEETKSIQKRTYKKPTVDKDIHVEVKEEKNTYIDEPKNIENQNIFENWNKFLIVVKYPSLFFMSLCLSFVTSLLVFFQSQTYLNEGYGWISWPISIICELSLVSLTVLYSSKVSRFWSFILFAGMFSYILGTMSYNLKSKETEEIINSKSNSETVSILRETLNQNREMLSQSIKRKESGNIKRYSDTVNDLTEKLSLELSKSSSNSMISIKYNGLIFLRAILMLFVALITHCMIKSINRISI